MKNVDLYGIDYDGPLPEDNFDGCTSYDDGAASVSVPGTENPLAYEAFQELTESVNPLCESDVYGVDIYSEVLHFFYSHT